VSDGVCNQRACIPVACLCGTQLRDSDFACLGSLAGFTLYRESNATYGQVMLRAVRCCPDNLSGRPSGQTESLFYNGFKEQALRRKTWIDRMMALNQQLYGRQDLIREDFNRHALLIGLHGMELQQIATLPWRHESPLPSRRYQNY
jgi:hypothetical protein